MALPLRTERLRLTRFALADVAELFAIRGHAEAMRFWDWPCDTSPEQTHERAVGLLADMDMGKALVCTARLATGGFVGLFDLSELDGPDADLGFMILPALWGQGLATEAAGALVEEAWQRSVRFLTARIHAENHASRRLLFRLGFRRQGFEALVEVAPERQVMCERFRLDRPASAGGQATPTLEHDPFASAHGPSSGSLFWR